jgi:hypothetical protein
MLRILCNSWPKAGTHALLELSRIVLGDGDWYRDPDIKYPEGDAEFITKARERLTRHAGQNFAIKGHFGRSEVISGFLRDENIRHLFAVRDPREVICSTYRWLKDLRPHWAISRHLATLTPEEQIEQIITGLPALAPFDLDRAVRWDRPLAERYAELTAWLDAPEVCVLRYEDMTGMNGCMAQHTHLARALLFLNVSFTADDLAEVGRSICNPQSATFHTGPASDWKRLFTERHRQLFVDTGGEVLVERLGYAPTFADQPATA